MKVTDILLAGVAGTTVFTLFSYLASEAMDENFKEPELLGKMIKRSPVDINETNSQFTGWLLHYLIGVGFSAAFKGIVDKTGIKPTITNGLITGAASGIPAALTWHTSLKLHPAPPRKKSWDYYIQLVAGHMAFGATCFLVLDLLEKSRRNKIAFRSTSDLRENEQKLSAFATSGS